MEVGLHTRLKPSAEERYEEYHRAVWPHVLKAMTTTARSLSLPGTR